LSARNNRIEIIKEGEKDRKTERQKERKTERQKERKTDRRMGRKTERQLHRGTQRQKAGRQKVKKTKTQKDRNTGRQKVKRFIKECKQTIKLLNTFLSRFTAKTTLTFKICSVRFLNSGICEVSTVQKKRNVYV
jgi:hypothetical protein